MLLASLFEELGVPWWIYVGTAADSGGRGIHLLAMKTSQDPDIPEFVTVAPPLLVAETPSPTFLELDPTRRVLFAVNEVSTAQGKRSGAVSAFAIDPRSGKLSLLGQRQSMGLGPCHLALHRERNHLLVANAGSGSVAVLPVAADGRLGEALDVRQQPADGAKERRPVSRPSGLRFSPDGKLAFVCDPGLDRIVGYRFDAGSGKLTQPQSTPAKPGAGPHRLVFRADGKFAYAVNQLDSTVTALAYDAGAGTLRSLQTLSTVPPQHDGPNRAMEIGLHPSGKYLLVANAGHDSLVLFRVDPAAGTLTYVEDQSTYGTMPVHFGMDSAGKHFAVANRRSGNVLILRAPESGRVKPGGDAIKLPGAACAVFLSPPVI